MRHSPERAMWICVLAEQLVLALRERDVMHLNGDVAGARRWIGTRHFRFVCALAGLDDRFVLRWVQEQLQLPLEDRHLEQVRLRGVSSGLFQTRSRRDPVERDAL